MSINGRALPVVNTVKCIPIRSLTTITAGDEAQGVTAQVSSDTGLTAQTISINNMGGFTGRYASEIEGHADVSMAGRTYIFHGTADGFDAGKPSARTTKAFAIEISC